MFLNTENVSIQKIVDELYDFEQHGVIGLENFLTQEAISSLMCGVISASHLFKTSQRYVGDVLQDMETIYLEHIPANVHIPSLHEAMVQFRAEYNLFYAQIAECAGFPPLFNSTGFHHYRAGSKGITPHQDFARDKNIIANFVLKGDAPFWVAKDREKGNAKKILAPPSTLILMRAARREEEQRHRPFHYIEPVEDDRYTMLIRYNSTRP
jgi:hypothetical protein